MKNIPLGVVGIIGLLVCLILSVVMIRGGIIAGNQYRNEISAPWTLADRASSIDQKAYRIDEFVTNLDRSGLQGSYNASYLKNPTNGFDYNFDALKTLQKRLHEIKGMDTSSPEYQWAIQQITAQEQGEALEMLHVFHGCWLRARYWYLWDWWGLLAILGLCLGYVVSGVMIWASGQD